MTIPDPKSYRIPNALPMIHTPAMPRAVTEIEYRAILLDMLREAHALTMHAGVIDPVVGYTVFELEETVIAAGLNLPIVRRAEHEQETE